MILENIEWIKSMKIKNKESEYLGEFLWGK